MILGMPVLQNIPLTLPYAMGIILGVFSLLISLSLFFFGFVLIVCGVSVHIFIAIDSF